MLFNSIEFLIFFAVVTFAYFALPPRVRWALVLTASCYFYMDFVPVYILILGGTIVVDYVAGLLISRATGRRRTLYLLVSIIANVGVLAVFKYYNFIVDNLVELLRLGAIGYHPRRLSMILPIGLSFHTFQAMSYTIEVYRGKQLPERHFGIYALYVMFFPQLVAGPIERPQNLLHQFHEAHEFSADRATLGLRRMLWGFFKKIVVADRLSLLVDRVYTNPHAYPGPLLTLATIFFAFQIYADFSGYSDIAIGAAEILGVRLMTNFRQPYSATSVAEFWSRWHISLSTWFRDYVYIPLGGNRVGRMRWRTNLLVTFVLSGLWHGASWTFVTWGALNGIYLVVETMFSRPTDANPGRESGATYSPFATMRWASTFFLICVSWIFFRANSMHDAVYVVGHFSRGWWQPNLAAIRALVKLANFGLRDLGMFAALVVMNLVDFRTRTSDAVSWISSLPAPRRWAFYYSVAAMIVFVGRFGRQQFIYFQF